MKGDITHRLWVIVLLNQQTQQINIAALILGCHIFSIMYLCYTYMSPAVTWGFVRRHKTHSLTGLKNPYSFLWFFPIDKMTRLIKKTGPSKKRTEQSILIVLPFEPRITVEVWKCRHMKFADSSWNPHEMWLLFSLHIALFNCPRRYVRVCTVHYFIDQKDWTRALEDKIFSRRLKAQSSLKLFLRRVKDTVTYFSKHSSWTSQKNGVWI